MKRSQNSPSLFAVSQWGIAEFFIVSQTAIPALLFLPGTQGIRFYVRVASFAISMALLVWWAFGNAKHSRVHPAQTWLVVSIIYTAAMVLHPFTSSTLAGIAQIVLYVSVMAPLFWAPAVVRGPDHLARLMTLLLICNGINAFVGVMQVYDPNRWMPQEMSRLVTESEFGLGAVSYQGPNGLIIRPPGALRQSRCRGGPWHVCRAPRSRVRDERVVALEARRRAPGVVRRRGRHLPEPGPRVARGSGDHARGLHERADVPAAEAARVHLRRSGWRPCRCDVCLRDRSRRPEHRRAHDDALRAGSRSACTPRRAAASSSTHSTTW